MSGWGDADAATFAAVVGRELDRDSPCTWPIVEGRPRCDDCPIPEAVTSGGPCSISDFVRVLSSPPPHAIVGGWLDGAGVEPREGWAR